MRATRIRAVLAAVTAAVLLGPGLTVTTTLASAAPAAPPAPATSPAPAAVAAGPPRDIAIPVGSVSPNYRFSSIAILRSLNADGSPGAPYAQVAGLPDGTLVAYRLSDGARLWGVKVGTEIQASPAVAYAQGRAFIAVGSMDGWVQVVDQNGGVVFRQQLAPGPGNLNGVFGTPAMADLDGDGGLDLVATSYNQRVNAWRLSTGAALPGFPVWVRDTIWSSPTIAHLDGDPFPEIVFGFDCAGESTQPCSPNYGGYVGALTYRGGWRGGFPVFVPRQVVWSTPAVADLEGNGQSSIIVGTGDYRESGRSWTGPYVYALRGDGTAVPGWPAAAGANTFSSPAVGALGADGSLSVAIVSTDGYLHVYDRGGREQWKRCIAACGNTGSVNSSPTIADVDGDGRQEVVVAANSSVFIYSADGTLLESGGMATNDPLTAAPTVVSVGGRTHVYILGATRPAGSTTTTAHLYDLTLSGDLGRADWPAFKQDSSRRGVLADHVWPQGGRNLGSTVRAPTYLRAGDYLQNGPYRAVMQGDGNFVVYGRSIWHSGTFLSGSWFAMQGDGNLVVYTQGGRPLWASNTGGRAVDLLALQSDGNLVLYGAGGALWHSGSYR
jgi:hypothetical protein